MVNPTNQTNTTIPLEIYEILKEIKEKQGCTFDEVLNQLCDLDQQHNPIGHSQDYVLWYNDVRFKFKITFRKENMLIEYITPAKEITSKISEWGLPDKVRKEFYTFIKEECSRCILENIPVGLIFKDFDIYKAF